LWNKRLVSPTRVNTPEETPDTTYKPHSNPEKNVVLSIYERHQQVLTLPENSVFFFVIILTFDVSVVITGILQPLHALRGFISPVLCWPLLLSAN